MSAIKSKPVYYPRPYFDADTLGNRLDTVISLLQPTLPGSETYSQPGTDFGVSLIAKTPFQLTLSPDVKIAYIQNISAFNITKGTTSRMTDGQGFILNAASTVGAAGDTQVIGPQGGDSLVALSNYWFTCNTTGVVLVCDYLQ